MKIFAGHVVIRNTASPVQDSMWCKEHDQGMSLYCFDCGVFICRDCTIKDHFNHNHEFVSKAAAQVKESLTSDLQPLQAVVTDISKFAEEIHAAKIDVESNSTSLVDRVEGSFSQLHTMLEDCKKKLLNEMSEKFREKFENLAAQDEMVSKSLKAIHQVIDYTNQCVQHLSDSEVVHVGTEVHDMIGRAVGRHRNDMTTFGPVEEANIDVDLCRHQDFEHFLWNATKLLTLPVDPSKCEVSGIGIKSAEVGRTTTFNITTKLTNGKATMQSNAISCCLQSASSGELVRCSVGPPKCGQYVIQYTPTIRGRNKLTIKVNEQEINDSPFPVFVYLPLVELDQPVHLLKQLSTPHDITVNSKGEIVVAEWNGKVVSFSKDMKRLKKADYNFGHLAGIAVDQGDNVYALEKSNWIVKLDDKLKFVKKAGHQGLSSSITVSVCNEVMVSEKEKNSITLYNTELEYLRQIGSHCAGQGVSDLSADARGHIYVIHRDSSRFEVLDSTGELLRTLDLSSMNRPCGIAVAGGHVFVTDEAVHKVFVYSTEGEFLASFGQWGAGIGQFYGPCGLCVKDSYIYVCDRYNNRIQIF
jgi:DNA-binding beta-propeller fold protein YncE